MNYVEKRCSSDHLRFHRHLGYFQYIDVKMGTMASQIFSLAIVYSTVYSGADQRKHQSSASLAFVRGIHRWPVNSPHKWPVTGKMFPFDDVIMFQVIAIGSGLDNIMVDQTNGDLWLGSHPIAWKLFMHLEDGKSPTPSHVSTQGWFSARLQYLHC